MMNSQSGRQPSLHTSLQSDKLLESLASAYQMQFVSEIWHDSERNLAACHVTKS